MKTLNEIYKETIRLIEKGEKLPYGKLHQSDIFVSEVIGYMYDVKIFIKNLLE